MEREAEAEIPLRWLWTMPLMGAGWAQATPTEPLSGGAGWMGAGLLGSILLWILFRHIPSLLLTIEAKDKLIKDLIDSRDVLAQAMVSRQGEQLTAITIETQKAYERQREETRANLQLVLDHARASVAALAKEINELSSEIRKRPRESRLPT